ncbi:zinc ribbon domain-containing protein [Paraburkholderia sp. LEh10]|uniref:zinc ribbon domain-containing protein n=1 Tax=Paraburkholderia sp. LEh10 TaxID=2821353 RepID=UPI003917FC7A
MRRSSLSPDDAPTYCSPCFATAPPTNQNPGLYLTNQIGSIPRSKAIIAAARRQAAREGHFSNYTATERSNLLRRG